MPVRKGCPERWEKLALPVLKDRRGKRDPLGLKGQREKRGFPELRELKAKPVLQDRAPSARCTTFPAPEA